MTDTKLNHHLNRLALVFVLCLAGLSASAQQVLDIEYAEHQRLSTRSLLLDITALSGGGFVAVGERGHAVYSADGKIWKQAEVVPTRSTLTTVAESGGRLWAAGHDSVILTSGDAGVTWTRQYYDEERQQAIMDLHFFNDQRGIAIGSYGLALFTTDGGASWEDGMINEEEWHNNALIGDGDLIMVAGEAGFSYRSLDGGQTWDTIEMPYAGSMFGIITTSDICVLVFGLRGHVQESCDAGNTWTELDTGTESSITGAVHVGDQTLMVGNSGLVLTRNDGTFRVEHHSSGVDFAAVVHAGGSNYLLAGEDGVHFYPDLSREDQ